jgi:peptide/nickel transport system substrate-binding protein
MKPEHRRIAVLTSAAILLSLSGACSASPTAPTPEPTILTYGLTLAPSGIDPHLNASSELGIPLASVYDTLLFRDPETGGFVPGLAETWSISNDGLSYEFRLRQDVVFHDGTPFNAEAVRANIEYILNPDNHSQKAAAMLGPLQTVEVVDDATVNFHLSEPYAPLLDSLAQVYLGMASPTALSAWGPTDYQFHQVGTGPYRFVEYIPNDHLTLERNPDYAWAPSIYSHSQAQIDRIVFLFFEDPATRALALESGEVDIIGEVPPPAAARLAGTANFNLLPVPIPGQPLQFLFNTRLSPTDDVRVRQALTLGVDRQTIVQTVFGEHSPVAQGPLSAVTRGFTAECPFPDYDPAAASSLLEQAGWVDDDNDGVRTRDGQSLALHLVAPSWGQNPEVAQLIQAYWDTLGAEVSLEVAAGFGPLKEIQASGQYHAIGINFFGTDPDLLRSFYTTGGLYDWTGVDDPAVDDMLLSASQITLDTQARLDLYAQFARYVRDHALILPIRDYVNLVVSNARVQGLRFSADGWYPLLIDLRLAP